MLGWYEVGSGGRYGVPWQYPKRQARGKWGVGAGVEVEVLVPLEPLLTPRKRMTTLTPRPVEDDRR